MANGAPKVGERILQILSDGLPHDREELRRCVDEMSSFHNLQNHLVALRKTLRPNGEDIVCELANRRIHYRHIRLLASATDGRR